MTDHSPDDRPASDRLLSIFELLNQLNQLRRRALEQQSEATRLMAAYELRRAEKVLQSMQASVAARRKARGL
jgi:hypothetical protein